MSDNDHDNDMLPSFSAQFQHIHWQHETVSLVGEEERECGDQSQDVEAGGGWSGQRGAWQ